MSRATAATASTAAAQRAQAERMIGREQDRGGDHAEQQPDGWRPRHGGARRVRIQRCPLGRGAGSR